MNLLFTFSKHFVDPLNGNFMTISIVGSNIPFEIINSEDVSRHKLACFFSEKLIGMK